MYEVQKHNSAKLCYVYYYYNIIYSSKPGLGKIQYIHLNQGLASYFPYGVG